jgi:hypothetical protein
MVKKRTYDDKMKLDMPFSEALERFAGVDPKEMHANIAKSKKKKPPGGKKRKAPPSDTGEAHNVVSLRDRRLRKRNYGR